VTKAICKSVSIKLGYFLLTRSSPLILCERLHTTVSGQHSSVTSILVAHHFLGVFMLLRPTGADKSDATAIRSRD